ncbi:hypothetical protein L2E82_31543 [Cichorium intybus]|uniref:Uncharacterized protein n=1 Tax=Cichorium intybus TaxID=13427 RepID=A0ACB9BF09_CICIN|nr:hypothetical protein L2E82_31543 [Cichorium intybus]
MFLSSSFSKSYLAEFWPHLVCLFCVPYRYTPQSLGAGSFVRLMSAHGDSLQEEKKLKDESSDSWWMISFTSSRCNTNIAWWSFIKNTQGSNHSRPIVSAKSVNAYHICELSLTFEK